MASLQEWPEPVVPVQSLSESGITVIPDRYIKLPSDRPSMKPEADHTLSIPVIDLHGLEDIDNKIYSKATIKEVSDACKDWGFFQVVNHGVSPDLMASFPEVWREFFHLPVEEKQAYSNTPKTYEGYGSRLGVEKGAILDWTDYYFLHFLPESLKDHQKWPSLPISLRELTESYSNEVVNLSRILLKVISMSLGLDMTCLQAAFGGGDDAACLRVCYYPKCPQPELTLGLSSHSDVGGLTILLADEHVGGLQVHKGNSWVNVQAVPNAFIVNIGDQIQVLSNATYKSVEHRVVANSSKERISMAFFHNPKGDMPIGPLPQLVKPEQRAMYPTITFGEYRQFIREKGPQGKLQVESLKALM